jgi:hypothetical protein
MIGKLILWQPSKSDLFVPATVRQVNPALATAVIEICPGIVKADGEIVLEGQPVTITLENLYQSYNDNSMLNPAQVRVCIFNLTPNILIIFVNS